MVIFSGEVVFPELIDGKMKLLHLCVECGPFHLDYVSYLRADFSRFDNDRESIRKAVTVVFLNK